MKKNFTTVLGFVVVLLTIGILSVAKDTKSNYQTNKKRFIYATIDYTYEFRSGLRNSKGTVEVSGVSGEIKKQIEIKGGSPFLTIMGDNGWELVTVTKRDYDGGVETDYFFKKELDN